VDTFISKISSCNAREFSYNDENFTLNKFERYYDGGYNFNFYNAFSNIRDVKYKNYSIFYLTDERKLSDLTVNEKNVIKLEKSLTSLNFGGIYLEFKPKDVRQLALSGIYTSYDYYGDYSFFNITSDSTNFIIDLKDSNVCNIYKIYNYKKYYLTQDSNNTVNFYTRKLGLSGIDFNYIYSSSNNSLCLFRNDGSCKLLTKQGNTLTLVPFTSANKILAPLNNIKIDKKIYNNIGNNENFTLVGYEESNIIPDNLIEKDLSNNFLLHSENDDIEIIALKNQLTQEDIFTSGNTLISSNNSPFYLKEMRSYTSIFNDIDSEKDESLSLNYVFYNKPYIIKSGINTIKAPNDLNPFTKININDTKFVESGAFSYTTPLYADKVYKLDNTNGYTDGQNYLCTWLSGSPLSDNKVWVDRYYYPDRIEKASALATNSTFNVTYTDLIEQLVSGNELIKQSLSAYQVFDKKSDFIIEPNDVFIYERLNSLPDIISPNEIPVCGIENSNYFEEINYFDNINTDGVFSIFFTFSGDNTNWSFSSRRNNINGGLSIDKNNNNDGNVSFLMNLYDPSNETIISFDAIAGFKKLKINTLAVAIDTINGRGYFNLNGTIIKEFTFDKSQFFGKKILFGDFVGNDNVQNFKIYTRYVDFDESLILPYINGLQSIDTLVITIPSGQRNSEDEIELLQSVCNNQTFKSNHVDILVKNINLPDNIKNELKRIVTETCKSFSPLTSEVNNIEFIE
jgi:hypothetical protein